MSKPLEWALIDLPWCQYGAKNEQTGFRGHPACAAGTLIVVFSQSRNAFAQYLIGDINEAGGVCDDCVALQDDDVVLRYARLDVPPMGEELSGGHW